MIFHLKFTILACLLLLFGCANGIRESNAYMRRRTKRDEINDITKTLTDSEIEMALSDLSLSDLNALSKLIDSSNSAEYADIEDSNERAQSFYDMKTDADESIDYDENEPETAQDIMGFEMPRAELISYSNENTRAKREDSQNNQGNTLDEEYLKLLENSFPHDLEQNDREDSEDKKEHIRVKRKQNQTHAQSHEST